MMQQQYSYSAQPHAAPVRQKGKYRDENDRNGNILSDSRVQRGNSKALLSHSGRYDTKRKSSKPGSTNYSRASSVSADFLEELTDRPIEQDTETQIKPFIERPKSPLFVRAKIGFDVATQVEKTDLFDFDLEVEPILEVLVGRTLHVSMLEIAQEDELEAIRLQQEEFEMIRNVELAEVQRLEAELKRKKMERERRSLQEEKRAEDKERLEEAMAARQFTSQFLGELHDSVFDALEAEGQFFDPVQREIEQLFIPQLVTGTIDKANLYDITVQVFEEIFENAQREAEKFEKIAVEKREALKERLRQEEEARRKKEEEERLAAEEAARKAAEDAENAENAPIEEE